MSSAIERTFIKTRSHNNTPMNGFLSDRHVFSSVIAPKCLIGDSCNRSSISEHLKNIRKLFQRLQKANLKLSPQKCRFLRKVFYYIGQFISADRGKTEPKKVKAVLDWPRSEIVHDIRSFLGL
ncbi:hypothetical protein AVEN_554-1 [Araneus ventricosus]|uniref:Reverse transcriptase domain-containing protein n=1 Tax=Araneus ventricosus TaxID=182803 RepID=A0A4Y2I910_ARAVE|nr:hypothetical protein AVEN_554-1 [Araneus ventricosus]